MLTRSKPTRVLPTDAHEITLIRVTYDCEEDLVVRDVFAAERVQLTLGIFESFTPVIHSPV